MKVQSHDFANDAVEFTFKYNNVHQAIQMSSSRRPFVWTPSAMRAVSYGRNNLNQYSSVDQIPYFYNENGCLSAGPFSATFDVLNRMTQVVVGGTTNDYVYDPSNREAQKSSNDVATGFLYDGQQMIEEYDDEGVLANRYIRGNRLDEIFIKIAGSSKTYLHHDRLGSVIARTDNSGAVLNRYKYGIFGETPSLVGTPFGYTGQRYDSEVALYNYKARIYSPAIGRFLQPDPIGFDAGDLNLYAYVNNDAVNLTDSAGLTAGEGGNFKTVSSPLISLTELLPILPLTDTIINPFPNDPGQASPDEGQPDAQPGLRWDQYKPVVPGLLTAEEVNALYILYLKRALLAGAYGYADVTKWSFSDFLSGKKPPINNVQRMLDLGNAAAGAGK